MESQGDLIGFARARIFTGDTAKSSRRSYRQDIGVRNTSRNLHLFITNFATGTTSYPQVVSSYLKDMLCYKKLETHRNSYKTYEKLQKVSCEPKSHAVAST